MADAQTALLITKTARMITDSRNLLALSAIALETAILHRAFLISMVVTSPSSRPSGTSPPPDVSERLNA
jgi:hypothetical protein